MPVALAIPLIAAVAPEVAAGALTALGITASATAAALGVSSAYQYLTSKSPADQFSTASANYLKAEQDRAASGAKNLGGNAQAEVNKEIAANYEYVGVDPKTGSLAVNADRDLANGGPLQLKETDGKVTLSNDQVIVEVPYTNYGTTANPSAVAPGVPINTATSDDGLFPVIQNREVISSDPQLVAQTAIEQAGRDARTIEDYAVERFTPGDVVTTEAVPVAQPVNQSQAYVLDAATMAADAAIDAETRERARAGQTGWQEDAGTLADPAAVQRAATVEQVKAREAADSMNQGPESSPPPQSTGEVPGSTAKTEVKTDQGVKKSNTSGVVSRSTEIPSEKPNPLHAYSNYTYNISWYMVPREVMNQITTGQIAPGGEDAILAQSELILRSGGSQEAQKGKYFGVDFFIDNLVMKTVVGISGKNRSTDVVEIDFEIMEPYNVTLLPRIVATAQAQTGRPDWAACFYIFKIQFFGYDDDGIPQTIPKTTKYIPHSLVSMNFDVTHRGAHYRFKAVPCHHFAQTLLDNQIPFHMEIYGKTMEELFNGAAQSLYKATGAAIGMNEPDPRETAAGINNPANSGTVSGTGTFTQGVAEALNNNEKYLRDVRKVIRIPTVYKFRFEDGIGDKKVVDPKNWTQNSFRMGNPKNPNELVGKNIKLDSTKNCFRVQSGTRITDLISSVMQVSDYMADQYKIPSPTDKPLYSFKIVPEVKFLDYDTKTNNWGREVTYVVIPYVIHGYDHEGFGQLPPPGVTKRYKWIFTGKNTDIIDVKILYEAAFYTIKNAGIPNQTQAEGVDDSQNNGEDLMTGVFPRRVKAVHDIADRNNTGPNAEDHASLAVAELFKRQFDSVPDNVSLNISIVGDPDLIQQDNIMYGTKTDKNKLIYDFGSLNFVHYEAFFRFEFVIPRKDYDPDTGLMDLSSATSNLFDGLYKIVAVTNEFRGGKFTQKLDNFRIMKQSKSSSTVSTDSAREPTTTIKTEPANGTLNTQPTTTIRTDETSNRPTQTTTESTLLPSTSINPTVAPVTQIV